MVIEHSLRATLAQLRQVLLKLSNEEYGKSLPVLSNASIGQHTRHIIEFLQTLNKQYQSGVINYDKRLRSIILETDRTSATFELSSIIENPLPQDKDLLLTGSYSSELAEQATVKSSYYREVVYNLEHVIHHMAMIKIGIKASTTLFVPTDFGVAPATIRHKKSIL